MEPAENISRRDERRGTRRLMLGAAIVLFVIALATLVWPFLPVSLDRQTRDETGRTQQHQGMSEAGKSRAPADTSPNGTNGASIGRAESIIATAKGNVELAPEQASAVQRYVSRHADERHDQANFTVSVGAAVPQQADLRDLPRDLANALPDYRDDQYIVVGQQLVVVEKQTRRIVAIIPVTG
jgi:uncharacterized protein HemX